MSQHQLAFALKTVDVCVAVCCLAALAFLALAGWHGAFTPAVLPQAGVVTSAYALAAAVPVCVIAALAWRIFSDIGRDNSFCDANAARLANIGYAGSAEGLITVVSGAAYAAVGAAIETPLLPLALVFSVSAALAVVGFALSHLTAKAAALKAENDLTV